MIKKATAKNIKLKTKLGRRASSGVSRPSLSISKMVSKKIKSGRRVAAKKKEEKEEKFKKIPAAKAKSKKGLAGDIKKYKKVRVRVSNVIPIIPPDSAAPLSLPNVSVLNSEIFKILDFKEAAVLRRLFNSVRSILAAFLIVSLSSGSLASVGDTFSYYNDTESSNSNIFIAGEIDFTASSTPWSPIPVSLNMEPGSTTVKNFGINPLQSNPFQYFASTTALGGDLDFCAGINALFKQGPTTLYNGPLSSLNTPTTTTFSDFSLEAGTGANNFQNKICNFGIDFNGWQSRHGYPTVGGFSDTEQATSTLASWGFRINKVYYDVDSGENPPPPKQCDALSQGYWKNNEGCSNGTGSSPRSGDVSALSSGFSGVFSGISGENVCMVLDTSSCPSGGTVAGQRCRAKTHTMADELNVVSGKLDLNAIIAGADDGDNAFDSLGLSPLSTVGVALAAVEAVIASSTASKSKLQKAAYVAERIYSFYEDENPEAPMCLYDQGISSGRGEEGDNEWVEIYNQTNIPLDISGFKICDNISCDTIPASTPLVPAYGYAVITNKPETFSATGTAAWYLPPDVVYIPLNSDIGNGLANNADMLILKRPDGVILDQMNWGVPSLTWANYNSNVWNPGAVDVAEGNLLGRAPSGYDTDQPSDWSEISPPSVDLTYPDEAGSYTWYWTYSYTITWNAINNNLLNGPLGISLFYIKDIDHSGTISTPDTTHTIVEGTENDGAYNFEVPSGFLGYIWVKLLATGPENPLNNTRGISGPIYDPVPLSILSEDSEDVNAEELAFLDPPVITLFGNNPAAIAIGSTYSDLGAFVTDNLNPNLGIKITGGEIDTSLAGVHEVIFEAVDQEGNKSYAKRIVVVYDPALGEPDLSPYLIKEPEVVEVVAGAPEVVVEIPEVTEAPEVAEVTEAVESAEPEQTEVAEVTETFEAVEPEQSDIPVVIEAPVETQVEIPTDAPIVIEAPVEDHATEPVDTPATLPEEIAVI